MKSLEKSQDKVQKICELLRHKALEPAQIEANAIIEEAKKKAEEIQAEAEKQKEQLLKQAKNQIEQEKNVFHSSLQQASKQTIEFLKQEIENKLFNEELQLLFEKPMADPKVISDLVNTVVASLEKEGIMADLSVVIPRVVSADDIDSLLVEGVRKRLKGKPLEIGSFGGGVQIKLIGKKMTLDLSDQALKELVAGYVRKDFRKLLFSH